MVLSIYMHDIVYNKVPILLLNTICRGDSVCMHRPRVPPDCDSWAGRTVRYSLQQNNKISDIRS